MNLVTSLVFLGLLEVVAATEPRVVGGRKVRNPTKYPYQVSLQYHTNHFCGGSILNNRWILTAGHCIDGVPSFKKSVLAMVGSVDNRYGNTYGIDYSICHQQYDDFTSENDIGMIRVDTNFKFNEKVQPIALPTEEFTQFDSTVFFSGWGRLGANKQRPVILHEIKLKVIPYNTCKPHIDATPGLPPLKETNICTLTRKRKGLCMGDSGGPLVADGVQIGICSFGEPCALGIPDVYTKVYPYVDWIEEEQMDYQLTNANNRHEPHLVIYLCASFSALFAFHCIFFISFSV